MTSFVVAGEPTGKGRPRFTRKGGYVSTYTPDKTASYERRVRDEYRASGGGLYECAVAIDIVAYFRIPASATKRKKAEMAHGFLKPTKKPDIDNIAKIILDGLNGICFRDDALVVELNVVKLYSYVPRVEVKVSEVTTWKGGLD